MVNIRTAIVPIVIRRERQKVRIEAGCLDFLTKDSAKSSDIGGPNVTENRIHPKAN